MVQKKKDSFALPGDGQRGEAPIEAWTAVETPDDGLRLISAFLSIRDPGLRAIAIDFVSELAERSEQA